MNEIIKNNTTEQHTITTLEIAEMLGMKHYKILEKFSILDDFVIKKFKLAFGNRILKQLRTFIPVYVACGGTALDGLDFIFTNKILKKFESLNIAFLRDELKQLNTELDKLFGKGNFKMAHAYINNLIKMGQ